MEEAKPSLPHQEGLNAVRGDIRKANEVTHTMSLPHPEGYNIALGDARKHQEASLIRRSSNSVMATRPSTVERSASTFVNGHTNGHTQVEFLQQRTRILVAAGK